MSDSEEEATEKQLKVVFLGDSNVGKTNLIRRFCYGDFSRQYTETIGADFYIKRIILPGRKEITVRVSDIAGTELNGHMLQNYLFKADIVVMVYDITNAGSFDNLSVWLECINNLVESSVLIAVFGNKCDLEHKRAVRLDKTNHFISDNRLSNYFVSAKTGENVASCMTEIVAKHFGITLTKFDKEKQVSVIRAELVPATPKSKKTARKRSTSERKLSTTPTTCVLQ